MSAQPFADFNPTPSAWGYNWRTNEPPPPPLVPQQVVVASAPQTGRRRTTAADEEVQLSHLPAALLGALKRDKKPFTYTPGGVDLSEVLNARLQKRMERRRRYREEDVASSSSPRQLVVSPTYNTPLDMYSVQNALEALEVQAGLVTAADKSLSSSSPARSATLPRNHTFRGGAPDDPSPDPSREVVTQSKAFRVLQIITDTEAPVADKPRPHHHDETRFTGIRDAGSIPSRFFHTLQKITGTDGEDRRAGEQEEHDPEGGLRRVEDSRLSLPAQSIVPRVVQGADGPSYSGSGAAALKRPAAFLPIKTTTTTPGSGFRPVRPPPYSNGPARGVAGTDF